MLAIAIGSFFEEVKKLKEAGVTPTTLGQYVAQKQTAAKLSSSLGREPTGQEVAQELIRQSHSAPTVTKTITPEEEFKEDIQKDLASEGLTPETWMQYKSIAFPGQMSVKEGGQDVSYFFWTPEGTLADKTFKPSEHSYQEMINWVYQRSKELQERQWESYYKPIIKKEVFTQTDVPSEFTALDLGKEYKHQAYLVATGQKTEEQARDWLGHIHSSYLEGLTPSQIEQYAFETTKWPTPSEIAHKVYREGMRPEDVFFVDVEGSKYLRPGAGKYVESLDPYSRRRFGSQLYIRLDDIDVSSDVSSRRIFQLMEDFPGKTPSEIYSEIGLEAYQLGPEGLRQKVFAETDLAGRIGLSFVPTFISAMAWPITLPQSIVKHFTGGKTLILPDVAEEIEKHRIGVHGVIGPAIAEQWFKQDVSDIKEMQMKYPLETFIASIGEVWGLYTGGKALGLGVKGIGYAKSTVTDYLRYGYEKMMMNIKPIGTSSGLTQFGWAKARFVGKLTKIGYEHGLYTPGAPSIGFRVSQIVGKAKHVGYEHGLLDLPGTPLSETFAWKVSQFTGKGLYKPGSYTELSRGFGGYKDIYPRYVTEQIDWWKYQHPGEMDIMKTLVYEGRGLIPERMVIWQRQPEYVGQFRDMTQFMPGEYPYSRGISLAGKMPYGAMEDFGLPSTVMGRLPTSGRFAFRMASSQIKYWSSERGLIVSDIQRIGQLKALGWGEPVKPRFMIGIDEIKSYTGLDRYKDLIIRTDIAHFDIVAPSKMIRGVITDVSRALKWGEFTTPSRPFYTEIQSFLNKGTGQITKGFVAEKIRDYSIYKPMGEYGIPIRYPEISRLTIEDFLGGIGEKYTPSKFMLGETRKAIVSVSPLNTKIKYPDYYHSMDHYGLPSEYPSGGVSGVSALEIPKIKTTHATVGRGFPKMQMIHEEMRFLDWLEFAEGGTDIPSSYWTGVKPVVKEVVFPVSRSGITSSSISVLDVFGIVKPVYELDVGIDIGRKYEKRRKPGVFNIPAIDTASLLKQAQFVSVVPLQVQKQKQDLLSVALQDLAMGQIQTAKLQSTAEFDFEDIIQPTTTPPPTEFTTEGFKIPPPPVLDMETYDIGIPDLPDVFISRKKKGRKRTHPTKMLFGDIYYKKI